MGPQLDHSPPRDDRSRAFAGTRPPTGSARLRCRRCRGCRRLRLGGGAPLWASCCLRAPGPSGIPAPPPVAGADESLVSQPARPRMPNIGAATGRKNNRLPWIMRTPHLLCVKPVIPRSTTSLRLIPRHEPPARPGRIKETALSKGSIKKKTTLARSPFPRNDSGRSAAGTFVDSRARYGPWPESESIREKEKRQDQIFRSCRTAMKERTCKISASVEPPYR